MYEESKIHENTLLHSMTLYPSTRQVPQPTNINTNKISFPTKDVCPSYPTNLVPKTCAQLRHRGLHHPSSTCISLPTIQTSDLHSHPQESRFWLTLEGNIIFSPRSKSHCGENLEGLGSASVIGRLEREGSDTSLVTLS